MKNIFTIPNVISFFRILLIPIFVVAYLSGKDNPQYTQFAIGVVVVSGISDVIDGFIARHFNMVSDVGKVLDPIADKLTQAVLLLSLAIKHLEIFPMFVVLFVKELLTLFVAAYLLTHGTKPISSKWFGKLSTAILYAVMIALIGFPNLPIRRSTATITTSALITAAIWPVFAGIASLRVRVHKPSPSLPTAPIPQRSKR